MENFRYFLQQVIESDRTSELSDHPLTRTLREEMRSLLEQLQTSSDRS